MPNARLYFAAVPSRRVTRRYYAEQLGWWRAAGWAIEVEDGEDGSLTLHTVRVRGGTTRLWGARASAEEVATPELTRRFLAKALYFHLHPRKARKLFDATGEVCTEKELAAFIRAQRRKAGKLSS